jgi:hypothetical protein
MSDQLKEQPSTATRLRGLLKTPDEGWSGLLAVLVMMLAAAVAIDESHWVGFVAGTKTSQTAFLPVLMGLAVLIGFLLGRSRISTLKSHAIAATVGAAYLLVAVSASLSSLPSLDLRLHALVQSIGTFIDDVTVRGIRSAETSIFLLLVGALLWAAGYLGAFALFRRHRAGPAITLAATALLINMSITVNDQLIHLVVLVAAALLLVVRTSLFSQVEQWRSRRIADSGYASQLFVRSGITFVVTAIALSLVLAVNASSAPLRPMWDKALDRMVSVGISLNHFLGGISGEARGPNLLFTPTQTLRDRWDTSSDPMFTAVTDDGRGYLWRGMTYDYFDGGSWQNVEANDVAVPAHADLQAAALTSDASLTIGRKQVRTNITPIGMGGRVLVAPGDAFQVDQPASVQTNAVHGLLGVSLDQDMTENQGYTVTSRVFYGVESGALTGADLANAGVNYGAYGDFKPYVDIQPNSAGPLAISTAQSIVDGLDPSQRDPYHIAIATRNFLQKDGGFSYTNDITGLCSGQNRVDCFLTIKKGFCEGFATAMAMMLRTQRIPVRYVTGFLPGTPEEFIDPDATGPAIGDVVTRRVVTRSASHAWVEVYFPSYGWYPFDPTPGLSEGGQETADLPEGPRATATDSAATQTPNFEPTPSSAGVLIPPTINSSGGSSGMPTSLAIGVFVAVLALAAGLILFARRRRLPGGGQMTYDSVAKIATRFGYAPAPSQTAYEYADRLALVVPSVTDELRVVATAKVESVYARREPSEELKVRLMIAYRRVRMSLVRLFMRRPHWVGPHWRR